MTRDRASRAGDSMPKRAAAALLRDCQSAGRCEAMDAVAVVAVADDATGVVPAAVAAGARVPSERTSPVPTAADQRMGAYKEELLKGVGCGRSARILVGTYTIQGKGCRRVDRCLTTF